ncbi:MAG: cytochrome c oxidase subunit 3 [Planctomycetota bacterium]
MTTIGDVGQPHDGHGGEHGHAHDPHLAHHFDTPQQQYDSAKMGMWTFLVTEILFFSGLFCAYTVYRHTHPEIFLGASKFLDKTLGAVNTMVLLFSSMTMAWAVRCAQLEQRRGLIINLALTIVCAFGFMGIKYVEYSHKFHDGLLPGSHYSAALHASEEFKAAHHIDEHFHGHVPAEVEREALELEQVNYRTFFSVYFGMTGLHGIHVLAGIGVLTWLLVRALRGRSTGTTSWSSTTSGSTGTSST